MPSKHSFLLSNVASDVGMNSGIEAVRTGGLGGERCIRRSQPAKTKPQGDYSSFQVIYPPKFWHVPIARGSGRVGFGDRQLT